jgi:hypothetical protein
VAYHFLGIYIVLFLFFSVGEDTQGLGVSRQLYVGIGHKLWHCGLGSWAVGPGG